MSIENGKHVFLGAEVINRFLDQLEYPWVPILNDPEWAILKSIHEKILKFGTRTTVTREQLSFFTSVLGKVEVQGRLRRGSFKNALSTTQAQGYDWADEEPSGE